MKALFHKLLKASLVRPGKRVDLRDWDPGKTPAFSGGKEEGKAVLEKLGLELNRSVIGSTVSGFSGPKERRIGGELDLSYRFSDGFSLFGAYQLMDVTNRNFRSGSDGFDHLFRVELTRSFR